MLAIVGTERIGAIREMIPTALQDVDITFPNDAAQPGRLRFQIHAEFVCEKLPSNLIVAESIRSLAEGCQAPDDLAVGFLTQRV
nr:hypothetical protein [Mesorhizobium sp.]